ncbi:MAG: 4Fe-4S binding protein [Ardenticatenaceae bacterium]|nr:4Fe-4S binding protein [Ardenticatenaceae bacterium]
MNLLALAERWGEALTSKPFGFAADRCLHTKDKFATCTACYDICPVNAIQPGKPPTFVSENCQTCRACLAVCPVNAFTADDEAQALLNCAKQLDVQTCEIVCGLNPDAAVGSPAAATAVRVRGCLAGLSADTYLALVGQGITKAIVRLDACADCPWGSLQTQVETQVQQAQDLLAAWGRAETITCQHKAADSYRKRPLFNASSPPVSRRELFRWREAEEKPTTEPDRVVNPHPFQKRLRFLQGVRQLALLAAMEADASLSGWGFALADVNDECTACGVCARTCPTGALQLETAVSTYKLTFSPQICIACDICAHVCAPQAITLIHDPTFAQVFDAATEQIVQAGSLQTCSKCHARFAAHSETQLCPICTFRRQNPFGSAMPPGFAASQANLPQAGRKSS